MNPVLPVSDIPGSSSVEEQDVVADLTCLLHKNISLTEIRHIVEDLEINLRMRPDLSNLIFKHVLETRLDSGWTTAEIYEFLEDPSLNPLGSRNFTDLIRRLTLGELVLPTIIEHIDHLKQNLALGSIASAEFEEIIINLPYLTTSEGTFAASNPELLIASYIDFWSGMISSSVLKPSDLEIPTLNLWLEQVMAIPGSEDSISLCENIIHALRFKGISDWQTMSNVILHILNFIILDQSSSIQDESAKSKSRRLRNRLRDVWAILRYQDNDIACQTIIHTTEFLVSTQQYDENRPQVLLLWAWMLQRMIQVRNIISGKPWTDFLTLRDVPRSQFQSKFKLDLGLRERCFLYMWMLRTLGQRTKFYYSVDKERMSLFERYLDHLKGLSGINEKGGMLDEMQTLMTAFQDRGLPFTDHVLVAAARSKYQKRLGITDSTPESMIKELNVLECGPLQKPEAIWDYDRDMSVKTLGEALFRQTARETDITDPDFVRRMLIYIETGKSHYRGMLMHLLSEHKPLRYALGRLQDSLPGEGTVQATQYLDEGLPVLDPQACLNTINFLALSFASSPSISDRTSWRCTYWCYSLLSSERAPILPAMSRALYHAGIRRNYESGNPVPKERRKFIMDVVAEAEGKNVANNLN
ncbi:uncharacterized protein GIQ15_05746 [Arthroderma uncinatum]|uniref:uncharacterized protein n=1 Tax=Arthroderma uncinatum TaxID=74035 RepID=UPI00144AAF6F|nr:uncharacterized protein GIQ15_05746 [Arthroderma uncinatum]KAF3480399.1 hypothetical protein GIQ15_05746 [Arthroderma uncinatum]